jgi:hypothetical protein
VLVELRKAWRDGTTHPLFEFAEFLEKLAALTPRPEVHVLLYPGVLAPHARWRRQIAGFRRAAASEEAAARRAERGASRGPRYCGLLHPADSPGPAPARSDNGLSVAYAL